MQIEAYRQKRIDLAMASDVARREHQMFRVLRPTVAGLSIVLVASILGAGGLAFSATSGATVTGTLTAPNQPGGLDHFLCYKASGVAGGPTFAVPPGVLLQNALDPGGFVPVIGKIAAHCNPATKILPSGLAFPPNSPSWHLACLKIAAAQQSQTVVVSNQFGRGTLVTKSPNQFCLPSLKSLTGASGFKPPAATEIQPDHFTCYPVSYVKKAPKFTPPPGVMVSDQFSPAAAVAVTLGNPKSLCVPTQKTLPTTPPTVFPITNHNANLLCFAVSPTPTLPAVWDSNQFGIGQLAIRTTKTLCLPSFLG